MNSSIAYTISHIKEMEDNKSRPVMMRIGSSTALNIGSELTVRPEEEPEDIPLPPDGGWGWVIVLSSFMCNLILDGRKELV